MKLVLPRGLLLGLVLASLLSGIRLLRTELQRGSMRGWTTVFSPPEDTSSSDSRGGTSDSGTSTTAGGSSSSSRGGGSSASSKRPATSSSSAAAAAAAAEAAAAAAAAAAAEGEPPDCRNGKPRELDYSAQELALQAQRLQAWRSGAAQGVGMCLAVKDQREDLAEWVDYHLLLGAAHIYVYDTGSEPPLEEALQPWVEAGTVTYHYVSDFKAAAAELTVSMGHPFRNERYRQWMVYTMCLRDYGVRHRWLAFIDSDEFLVLTDSSTPNLPALLARYERYGGVAANWRILGSSGHAKHQNSTLLAYTACYPDEVVEQHLTKSIVNTAWAVQPASPHNAHYAGGCHAVLTDGTRVDKPSSKHIAGDRLLVYHYVTKSREDYEQKMRRGGGLGVNFRDMGYWKKVQKQATETCTAAADAWRNMQSCGRRICKPA